MNRTFLLATACTLSVVLPSLGGCDRYRVTLNERVISEPPGIITSVDVSDSALKTCLEQTLADQQINSIDKLTTLVCTHAGITNLEGVELFSKLRVVNLASNGLTSISPLLFLGDLTSVNLDENKQLDCTEISALKNHLPNDGTLISPKHCS